MRKRIVLLGAAAAGVLSAVPAHAAAKAPAPTAGRITGVVSSSTDARRLPCPAATATPASASASASASSEHIGIACLPKKAARWVVDQGADGCTIRSDITTGFRMMGDCVLTVDEGTHVKVWAPPGAISEEFRLVWRR